MDIAVHCVIVLHKRRSTLRIIEEMEFFVVKFVALCVLDSLGQMGNQLSVGDMIQTSSILLYLDLSVRDNERGTVKDTFIGTLGLT